MNAIGMRKSSETHGVKRRYDLEAFIVAMHNCRRWSTAKSTATWDEYKSNAEFMAVEDNHDYGGPADAPLRICLPGWLTCSDYDDDVSARYQYRSMLTSSKAESLSDEHRAQMLAETNIGMTHLFDCQQRANFLCQLTPPAPRTTGAGLLAQQCLCSRTRCLQTQRRLHLSSKVLQRSLLQSFSLLRPKVHQVQSSTWDLWLTMQLRLSVRQSSWQAGKARRISKHLPLSL